QNFWDRVAHMSCVSGDRELSKIVLARRRKSEPDWRYTRDARATRSRKSCYDAPGMTSQVLSEKVGVVFGVANKRSIAWAIAKAWAAAGARLIFNYQGERLKENVADLVGEFGENVPLFPCDVSSDEEIA